MQNLVVFRAVYAHVRVPFGGTLEPRPIRVGRGWPHRNTLLFHIFITSNSVDLGQTVRAYVRVPHF